MKWIHFLLVSKCCISIYTLIWCSHNHTLLVLVFFPAKESSNLTFMVPLAEHPLGARTVDDTQSFHNSTYELSRFVVMCCCFPLLHHEHLEDIKDGKQFLGHFVHLFWTCFLPCLRKLVHFQCFKACLPPFHIFQLIHKKNKGMHIPI